MAEVSSFELIYKKQSPAGEADIVLQGYFLNISNLEDVRLTFRVDFVTSRVDDPDRNLAGNTIAFIDTPNENNIRARLLGSPSSTSFLLSPNVTIPARGTAKVALLPSDPFVAPDGPVDFEARGYVRLTMPLIFRRPPNSPVRFPFLTPQLRRPARVLLTPQNRATYFASGPERKINDQTQSSLPTASGAALAEVETSGFVRPFVSDLGDMLVRMEGMVASEPSSGDVAMMLAMLASPESDLEGLNAELKKANIGIAVKRRKS